MYLIKEIFEKDLQLGETIKEGVRYRLRKAARALVFQHNKIAILNAGKLHFHTLPGGEIENNESVKDGLSREILEETGCKIINVLELGVTIEYRNSIELLQVSYVFTSDVIDVATPNFTQKEVEEGYQLLWLTVEEAIHLMKNKDNPATYAGKFIHERDLAILEYFKRDIPSPVRRGLG